MPDMVCENYQGKFEKLILRVGTLTQSQKIELYISGLADYITIEVELHNHPDLATAMSLSRHYECKEQPVCSQSLDDCQIQNNKFLTKISCQICEETEQF